MNPTIPFLPEIRYEEGFWLNGKNLPYYSFCEPNEGVRWTEEMDDFIAEASKHHFIDLYNRKIVVDALRSILERPAARYMDIGCSSGYMLGDILGAFPNATIY